MGDLPVTTSEFVIRPWGGDIGMAMLTGRVTATMVSKLETTVECKCILWDGLMVYIKNGLEQV